MATTAESAIFRYPSLDEVVFSICSPQTPIVERMAALFTAKHIGGNEALAALTSDAVANHKSVLFRHEAAYVLGQMGDSRALPFLRAFLYDENEHYMVRHEAAEAMAAINSSESMADLEKFLEYPIVALSETCQLALQSMKDKVTASDVDTASALQLTTFRTVDPVASKTEGIEASLASALSSKSIDIKGSMPLYRRYQTLFALRQMARDGNESATDVIINSILQDKLSALFRHEVAFVLGQLRSQRAIVALCHVLNDENEDPMVRHESAFSIGSILAEASQADKKSVADYAIHALDVGAKHKDPIIAESCLVALDEAAVYIKHNRPMSE